MKTKKLLLIVTVLLISIVFQAHEIYAKVGWFKCSVERAGTLGEQIILRLTDNSSTPAFKNKRFKATSGKEKETLAIGLMSINAGLPVRVQVDPDAGTIPRLLNLELLSQ